MRCVVNAFVYSMFIYSSIKPPLLNIGSSSRLDDKNRLNKPQSFHAGRMRNNISHYCYCYYYMFGMMWIINASHLFIIINNNDNNDRKYDHMFQQPELRRQNEKVRSEQMKQKKSMEKKERETERQVDEMYSTMLGLQECYRPRNHLHTGTQRISIPSHLWQFKEV